MTSPGLRLGAQCSVVIFNVCSRCSQFVSWEEKPGTKCRKQTPVFSDGGEQITLSVRTLVTDQSECGIQDGQAASSLNGGSSRGRLPRWAALSSTPSQASSHVKVSMQVGFISLSCGRHDSDISYLHQIGGDTLLCWSN